MTDTTETETIPAQRLAPIAHLQRAAKAPVASDAERYHLSAATAEAITRLLDELHTIGVLLRRTHEEHLAVIAEAARRYIIEHPTDEEL